MTQLPAIAAREYNNPDGRADWDFVDVLWFPTGGGKTEAYLGLIVCTAFFDRLRGKKAGVTAWMRFPLRLLSLQQLQRLADILGAAELLRRQTSPINEPDNDPFSVAYLVGSGKPNAFVPVTLKDPSPTLQIQDELHLLREELGAFDGHYETFMDTYQQEQQQVRTKVIAATATIEEYENQVRHLYDRRARRFPVPGPTAGESFYATTLHDDTRRLFVGIMPHNYTHINAVIRLAELFHRGVEDLRRDPAGAIARLGLTTVTTPDEFLAKLSYYEVFVTYLLSKREGDRLNQSMEGQLNQELTDNGYADLVNKSIIGETPFSEVAAILDELANPDPDFSRRLRSLTATSTISHGVDVERINYMCFFGMPRQTAEYIQTSSRSGRDHPGVVLVCFNPARERDQSHYHFFAKYHEYLDRLVEPVPINRWSKFSIRRTLPGLFMALLLNDYNLTMGGSGRDSLYFSRKARQLIESQQILPDEVAEYLQSAYRTTQYDAGAEFEQVIGEKVNEYIDMLRNPRQDFTSGNLTDQPMQSLRDIDEQLNIYLNRASRNLWNSLTRGRGS